MEEALLLVLERFMIPFALKEEQKQLLQALCEGKHAFGVMPTGFGKSMAFTLIPFIMDEVYHALNPFPI